MVRKRKKLRQYLADMGIAHNASLAMLAEAESDMRV
jgi:hypothetical protein